MLSRMEPQGSWDAGLHQMGCFAASWQSGIDRPGEGAPAASACLVPSGPTAHSGMTLILTGLDQVSCQAPSEREAETSPGAKMQSAEPESEVSTFED